MGRQTWALVSAGLEGFCQNLLAIAARVGQMQFGQVRFGQLQFGVRPDNRSVVWTRTQSAKLKSGPTMARLCHGSRLAQSRPLRAV